MTGFILVNSVCFIGAGVFWEIVAWFMHKYIMHGFGWYFHKDHHTTTGRRIQKNDIYAIFFALVSFFCIYSGLINGIIPLASAGFGIALYGIGYVLFHDVMFHKRIKWLRLSPCSKYLKRIVNAHRIHHKTVTRNGAVSFSFLYAPKKYSQEN